MGRGKPGGQALRAWVATASHKLYAASRQLDSEARRAAESGEGELASAMTCAGFECLEASQWLADALRRERGAAPLAHRRQLELGGGDER